MSEKSRPHWNKDTSRNKGELHGLSHQIINYCCSYTIAQLGSLATFTFFKTDIILLIIIIIYDE